VRYGVSGNPSAPAELLSKLASELDDLTVQNVLFHKNTPRSVKAQIYNSNRLDLSRQNKELVAELREYLASEDE
jgi:hypothetical protein